MANEQPVTRGTLGLTGLTMNAMALIAPGAFLWLTFQMQSLYGAPLAGMSMWFGILFALLLCLATAISYAELSKLYPGPGSSYLYAEQAFLSKTHAYKFARVAKFITGWASHLYYWVYPGVMVGVTAILAGFLLAQFFPGTFSGNYNSPLFMCLFCGVFAFGVAYIAYRGVTGTTAVNVVINIIQISALLVFAVIAIGYRVQHPQNSVGYHLSNGVAVTYQVAQVPVKDDKGKPTPVLDDKGKPTFDKAGKPVYQMQDGTDDKTGIPLPADKDGNPVKDPKLAAPFTVDYVNGAITKDDKGNPNIQLPFVGQIGRIASRVLLHLHTGGYRNPDTGRFRVRHGDGRGGEAPEERHPARGAPVPAYPGRGLLPDRVFRGELHAAQRLHHAAGRGLRRAARRHDGTRGHVALRKRAAGKAFMLVQAFTVFLALIGTTLSCLSTGARVTYAMGRDEEVPSHFGLLHGKTASPHRAIWALAMISAIIGIITVTVYLGGTTPAVLDKHNFWYSFGIFSPRPTRSSPTRWSS